MTINQYRLTAAVTIPAGTLATATAGEPGTGAPAGYGNAAVASPDTTGILFPYTFHIGQLIALDPTGPMYALIGGGNLVQVTLAQDTGGVYGTSN